MRNAAARAMLEYLRTDVRVFLITGDAGYGVLDEHQSQFPDRFLNLGVAEQNMIGFAAGLSLTGYRVFVYNIAPFVLYRCYEQVRNDICYQNLPVTLVGVGSGLAYAPGGMTHYAIEDIALARTLPNLSVFSPADPLEAKACMNEAYRSEGPSYIRIPKTGEPPIHSGMPEDIRRPQVIREGERVAILFHGTIGADVLSAVSSLSLPVKVISIPMLSPVPYDGLKSVLGNVGHLLTVEEHYIEGGLGTLMAEWIGRERLPWSLKSLGIPHAFVHQIRHQKGMREEFGFSPEAICRAIQDAWEKENRNG